jgi:hypothetical protein
MGLQGKHLWRRRVTPGLLKDAATLFTAGTGAQEVGSFGKRAAFCRKPAHGMKALLDKGGTRRRAAGRVPPLSSLPLGSAGGEDNYSKCSPEERRFPNNPLDKSKTRPAKGRENRRIKSIRSYPHRKWAMRIGA